MRQAAAKRREPHGGFPAERHRRCGLQECAREHRRAAVLARELRERVADLARKLEDSMACRAQAKRDGAVDRILTGGAEMDVTCRLGRNGRDLRGKRLYESNSERARLARIAGEGGAIEARAGARLRNYVCVALSEKPASRARSRKRRFEARHRGEQLLVRQGGGATLIGKNELEAQKSKNTVSSRPCRMTFHSRVPSPIRRAISVERRSTGTSARTGSLALAGSSGKYMRVCRCFSRPRMKMVTLR